MGYITNNMILGCVSEIGWLTPKLAAMLTRVSRQINKIMWSEQRKCGKQSRNTRDNMTKHGLRTWFLLKILVETGEMINLNTFFLFSNIHRTWLTPYRSPSSSPASPSHVDLDSSILRGWYDVKRTMIFHQSTSTEIQPMIEKSLYVYIHYIIHYKLNCNYMPMNLMDLKLLKKKWTRRE